MSLTQPFLQEPIKVTQLSSDDDSVEVTKPVIDDDSVLMTEVKPPCMAARQSLMMRDRQHSKKLEEMESWEIDEMEELEKERRERERTKTPQEIHQALREKVFLERIGPDNDKINSNHFRINNIMLNHRLQMADERRAFDAMCARGTKEDERNKLLEKNSGLWHQCNNQLQKDHKQLIANLKRERDKCMKQWDLNNPSPK